MLWNQFDRFRRFRFAWYYKESNSTFRHIDNFKDWVSKIQPKIVNTIYKTILDTCEMLHHIIYNVPIELVGALSTLKNKFVDKDDPVKAKIGNKKGIRSGKSATKCLVNLGY